jgi:hypothetical protein
MRHGINTVLSSQLHRRLPNRLRQFASSWPGAAKLLQLTLELSDCFRNSCYSFAVHAHRGASMAFKLSSGRTDSPSLTSAAGGPDKAFSYMSPVKSGSGKLAKGCPGRVSLRSGARVTKRVTASLTPNALQAPNHACVSRLARFGAHRDAISGRLLRHMIPFEHFRRPGIAETRPRTRGAHAAKRREANISRRSARYPS